MLHAAINVYSLIVLAAVILSWFPGSRGTPIALWLERVTEPVLAPIRRIVPPIGGLDLSPMLLLLALQLLRRLVG